MKLPVLADLNAIGLRGAADRALLAAHWLKIATVSSPAVVIVPEVPAIPARAEVIAQTAKPARAATAIVPAAQNTTGFGFGELYLNSPAYPAGTQIPAITPKGASAAVVGVAAVVAVPKVPAVTSPKIDAVKGWQDAIQITSTESTVSITAYLPFASSPELMGVFTDNVGNINEMTSPTLIPGKWMGTASSSTPGSDTNLSLSDTKTVEQFLFKQALALTGSNGGAVIENQNYMLNGVLTSCKKITIELSATEYLSNANELQLNRIN